MRQEVEIYVQSFGGMNTALNPAQLPKESCAIAKNAVMREIGTIGKRDGSVPVTTSALGAEIKHLTKYKTSPTSSATDELYASSGTTLYKLSGTALNALTMTASLNTSDIYTVGYTDANNVSRLLIADGASLKQCDGSTVTAVTPAADDPAPAPPNDLTNINTDGCKYIWVHNDHVFISAGKNEYVYSKRYYFDYFPSVQYFQLAHDNDYVNGCGVTYNGVCLIPMRRGWNILSGTNFDDFDGSQFLNTVNGVIAPRSIARVTYPNGQQTVVYLSDDGIHEIFDTGFIDSGTRQYATRSLMSNKIDFNGIGFTEAEKAAAYAEYDSVANLYKLWISRDTTHYCYVMDTRNMEWYQWELPNKYRPSLRMNNVPYFAGTTGHIHKFAEDLCTDWNESTQSTGTAVDWDVYMGIVSFSFSGYKDYWDRILIEAKQWGVPSKLDVQYIYGSGATTVTNALINQIMVYGETEWGFSEWANTNYTDILNNARPIRLNGKKGKYFQLRMKNDRDEPVLVYKLRYIGRTSNKV